MRRRKKQFMAAILLSFILLTACSKKEEYVTRTLNWGMTKQQVWDNQVELPDTGEMTDWNDTTVLCDSATMFDLPCSVLYDFSKKDGLIAVCYKFDNIAGNLNFLLNKLKDVHGDYTSDNSNDDIYIYEWETKKGITRLSCYKDDKDEDDDKIGVIYEIENFLELKE